MFTKKKTDFASIADGEVIPLEAVNDSVFSSKMLGDGFAVRLMDNKIYSPIKGKVKSVFPTKHAIYLVDALGNDILLHIGLDTVELNGEGFTIFVKEDQKVPQGSLLAEIDRELIEKKYKKDTTSMVIITNNKQTMRLRPGIVKHGEVIGSIDK